MHAQHSWKTYPKEQIQKVFSYCDIIVGNSDEALAVAQSFQLNVTDLHDIARMLAELPKVNTMRKRIVMITQQELPVIVCSGILMKYRHKRLQTTWILNETYFRVTE